MVKEERMCCPSKLQRCFIDCRKGFLTHSAQDKDNQGSRSVGYMSSKTPERLEGCKKAG